MSDTTSVEGTSEPVQTSPVQSGHDSATTQEKIVGLRAQLRQDVAAGAILTEPASSVADAVKQRLTDSGIALTAEEFDELVAEVTP